MVNPLSGELIFEVQHSTEHLRIVTINATLKKKDIITTNTS